VHRTTKTKRQVKSKLVISPSKKKSKTYAKIQIAHSKDDEEKSHLDKVGCGDDEQPQVEATQVDSKKELEVNPEHVIKDIQVNVSIEPLILATKVFKTYHRGSSTHTTCS
jgi:hypothetical protein